MGATTWRVVFCAPIDPEDKDANTDSMVVVEGAVEAASGGENMDVPAGCLLLLRLSPSRLACPGCRSIVAG